jgi:PilZ domain
MLVGKLEGLVSESDRRNVQRFQLKLPLIVRWSAEEAGSPSAASTESQDVSSRGVYFFLPEQVEPGAPIEIVMTLPNEITMAGPVRVRCLGKVHRTEKQEAGKLGVVATIERYEFLRAEEESA